MTIKSIAVVGTGLMGKGISQAFSSYGYKVNVFGRRDDAEMELQKYLDNEFKKGRLTPGQKDTIFSNISFYNINLQPEQLSQSDLIIETVKEDMDTKKEVFDVLSKYARNDTVLASNTSSYSIFKLAKNTPFPNNFVGIHFFSPVPVMKLVEVVKWEENNTEIIQTVCELVRSIDKIPVEVKDSPGFVLNRGLFTMINEAVYMLDERIANSAEDIDSIFINGMGMKVGPLKLADLVGIDVVYTIMTNMYEGFAEEKYKPCRLLKLMVDDGTIGKKASKGFYSY